VLEDGTLLPAASAGPGGAVVPIAAGMHTYVITCTGAFQLRRVLMTHAGADDRLSLRGRIAATLAALGLPGADLTISLRDAGGTFFTATVPGALLVPNRNGTRLRFRDASGTLAGGITNLRIGGRRRSDLGLQAQNLNLSGAGPGDFTAELVIGARTLESTGTLRAQATRLVYP
jgi:hypothetical protein